ncbi:hypothetical protein PUN28_004672 [Cardiocondyla obscurior]|uniref:Uncharacterized protein n=1 Tax=Cardiocondyla obscurior TaxID=286306 RepID=A0AAW2GH41_9HYME
MRFVKNILPSSLASLRFIKKHRIRDIVRYKGVKYFIVVRRISTVGAYITNDKRRKSHRRRREWSAHQWWLENEPLYLIALVAVCVVVVLIVFRASALLVTSRVRFIIESLLKCLEYFKLINIIYACNMYAKKKKFNLSLTNFLSWRKFSLKLKLIHLK